MESQIAGVEIVRAGGIALDPPIPAEAMPFTVALWNRTEQTIALVGVRFDMTGPKGERYSVIHYADMLRTPEKAELTPGRARGICAEASYTARRPDQRGRMNLANLRRMLSITASLDCVAFDDGQFKGPDTRGAFERLTKATEEEQALLAEMRGATDIKAFLEARPDSAIARRLLSVEEPLTFRPRIPLWRA